MLTTRTRILYGIGGGIYSIKEAAYAIFILLFYTQVLGLSGMVTGIIIAISLVWDGISDPLIGSWSDRLNSRYGRRHPFMVYSTLPIAIGFIGLFSPPSAVVENGALLAAWLLFWSLWVRTFITAFSIPHLALSAELTSDYHIRSRLLATRLGFMFMVTLLLPAAGLIFVFGGDQALDGRFIAANYPWYGLMSAALAIVLGVVTVMGTRHHTSQPDHNGEDYAPPGFRSYIEDVVATFRNSAFRRLISYEVACAIGWGSLSTLNVLVATYAFEFDADEMAILLAVPAFIGVLLVWTLLGPLSQRWQKPQCLRFALWGMLANTLWLYPLKLAGMLPPNDSPVVLALYMVHSTFFMFFFLFRMTISMSIVADLTDQHELDQGERKEGGFFSIMTFTLKIATLFGPLYGGIVLDVIGLNQQDLPGEVPEPVLAGLLYAVLLIVIPTLIVALRFAYMIDISRDEVENIQATLIERRAST
jgi:GPH family glycoside/pentoside/hexuronide:cation symporter